MLPALALATALTSTPRPISISDVRQIEIVSSWGGFGTSNLYHVVLNNSGDKFTDGKYVIAPRIISDLLTAISQPPIEFPNPAQILERETNEELVDYPLRQCVGDAADLPAVKRIFTDSFARPANKKRWVEQYFGTQLPHTDDYPKVSIRVTLRDESIIAVSSQSQSELMLPFEITQAGRTIKSFDPALSRAIALVVDGNTNSDRLHGKGLYDEYGAWLCGSDIHDAVLKAYTPELWKYLHTQKWVLAGKIDLRLSPDLGSFSGELRQADWPKRFSFAVEAVGSPLNAGSVAAAATQKLAISKVRGEQVLSLPWIQRWYQSAKQPELLLQWFNSGPYAIDTDEILVFLKHHAPALYRQVHAVETKTIYGRLADKTHDSYSGWLFLPDGRTLLVDFSNKASTLGPLEGQRIRSWSSFAADENDPTFEFRYTAVVLDRNGAVTFKP